ncbi:MAG TPA: DegT/DnrJ/EryC1/StrS aminotransferase family protein [Methanoculleus sp.]|nr:DegT/DnrJ/EryC1/StrS aminotransferase family protein [Methanoculleus sp.]
MIPVFKPSLGEEEIAAIRETFASGWIGIGPKTEAFEQRFAGYIGTPHAIGVNSATAALDLSLKAFGIESGEILIPAITFISTAHAAVYNHATPVLVDVSQDTLCMDIDDLQEKITDRARAIIPVHLGGHPCDMGPILELAGDHNLIVIEDAANATGAVYRGQKVGSFGDAGCFSFQATKNMTTGDGGMITTSHAEIVERLQRLRWVGIDQDTWQRDAHPDHYSWYYEVTEIGYKCHMNDIQASIGLVQLQKLEVMNAARRRIARIYDHAFSSIPDLSLPVERPWATHAYWLYTLKMHQRDAFIAHMSRCGISTGVHFMPVHHHPCYAALPADVPVAERIWKEIVDIPIYPDLTDEELQRILHAVKTFYLPG